MLVWDLLVQHKEGSLSYKDGVALFLDLYPTKKTLLSFFETEDAISRKKLNALLMEKYQELAKNREENNFQSFAPSKHKNNPINLENLPAELRKEYAKLGPLIREISNLHARLFNCATSDLRKPIAFKIVELSAQRRGIFFKIDSYHETGKVIEAEKLEKVETPASAEKNYKLEYELKLLRSQKSKLKDKPNRIEEFNAVVKKINEILKKRYV